MNSTSKIFTAQNVFASSLILAGMLLAFLAPKAAVNVDEMLHYPHAKQVVNWYFTGGDDVSCLDTPITNLKYYGQSVDNFTALINRVFHIQNEFLTRHFTGAFFFWLLLFFSGLLGKELTNSYRTAALVVLAMILTPRLFGQAFGNLKDIPFAVGYVAGILFIIRILKSFPKQSWRNVIFLALAIAFTISVRVGGLILFAYLGLGISALLIAKPFLLKYIVSTKSCIVRLTGQGLTIAVGGYFLGLLFWPFALQDVFHHPLQSLSMMEHYAVSIKQIFDGQVIWSSNLPPGYLIRWIGISTPEFILMGLIYFIAFLTYKFTKPGEQLFLELFALFTLVFPVVYVILIRSNLYSGIRQMLFVMPIMVVLAIIGFQNMIGIWEKGRSKFPYIVLFFGLMILSLVHEAKTFPVDYVYFNSVSGGNKKAWGNYEYDYYFQGMKEATDDLISEIGNKKVTVAMNCQLPNYFENISNIDFQYTRYLERSSVDWDYGLFGVNYIHPWQLKNNTWQSAKIVKTYSHKGNPLVVLVQRGKKTDMEAIRSISEKKWDEGEHLIKDALESEPNNVWLFVNLANLKLAKSEYAELDSILAMGRTIHPYYEPFYLIEAQKWFNQENYDAAAVVLKELNDVNPFYEAARPLVEKVEKKLNIKLN